MNGDFGAIPLTERGCADLLNGESHTEKVIDTIADSLSLVLARKAMRYSGEHSIMF